MRIDLTIIVYLTLSSVVASLKSHITVSVEGRQ